MLVTLTPPPLGVGSSPGRPLAGSRSPTRGPYRPERAQRPLPSSPMTGPWRRPMGSRDTSEEHRASTPLELLYDLCFVVALARAATLLHHDVSHGDAGYAVVSYVLVFFAIWWAWM